MFLILPHPLPLTQLWTGSRPTELLTKGPAPSAFSASLASAAPTEAVASVKIVWHEAVQWQEGLDVVGSTSQSIISKFFSNDWWRSVLSLIPSQSRKGVAAMASGVNRGSAQQRPFISKSPAISTLWITTKTARVIVPIILAEVAKLPSGKGSGKYYFIPESGEVTTTLLTQSINTRSSSISQAIAGGVVLVLALFATVIAYDYMKRRPNSRTVNVPPGFAISSPSHNRTPSPRSSRPFFSEPRVDYGIGGYTNTPSPRFLRQRNNPEFYSS